MNNSLDPIEETENENTSYAKKQNAEVESEKLSDSELVDLADSDSNDISFHSDEQSETINQDTTSEKEETLHKNNESAEEITAFESSGN